MADNIEENNVVSNDVVLKVADLKKEFVVKRSLLGKPEAVVKALDGVSFEIKRGETFGIVGESGCGKSTLGRTVLMLENPTSGKVFFNGTDITLLDKEELRQLRRKVQIIFQDPYASLNPRETVRELIRDPLDSYNIGTAEERNAEVEKMAALVGLDREYLNRYPHEFSGGQRQRIVIARALIVKPEFVVCDEPVSALDVSVRSQVLNLLKDLQKQLGLTMMFISHDLSVVKYITNRIAVMYLGHIVELSGKSELYSSPAHPYSQALISAIPTTDLNAKKERKLLEGDVPSPINPPSGCVFRTRCPYATERCADEIPQLKKIGQQHYCACHYPNIPDKEYNI